jgi:hypothetical protein
MLSIAPAIAVSPKLVIVNKVSCLRQPPNAPSRCQARFRNRGPRNVQKINFMWPCLLFRKQVPIAPGMKLTLLLRCYRQRRPSELGR